MKCSVFKILLIFQERRQFSQIVATGRFDANHFVALLGEKPRRVRSSEASDIDDAKHLFSVL
jgi:hypothetical protein